jgi:hypothetical protein
VVVDNLSAGKICIGDVQAGNLAPASTGQAYPPISH